MAMTNKIPTIDDIGDTIGTLINQSFIAKKNPPGLDDLKNWWFKQDAGSAATGQNSAMSNASSTNRRRLTAKGRSAAKAKTISGSNNVALLRYFQDHPTATYTRDQIAENSPFKGWRPQEIGAALSRLTKLKALQKSGNGWSLTRTGSSITELNPRQQVRATKKMAPLTLAAAG